MIGNPRSVLFRQADIIIIIIIIIIGYELSKLTAFIAHLFTVHVLVDTLFEHIL